MDYWQKQTVDKPLFPDLIWSRPENKALAGRLLIIGGHLGGFSAPVTAYNHAKKAGIGEIRVLLPESLKKGLGSGLDEIDFLPATPSGGLAQSALAELIDHAAWADCVLLAGDLGQNSETKVLFERYLSETANTIVLVGDSVDFGLEIITEVLVRGNLVMALKYNQLQHLLKLVEPLTPLTTKTALNNLVDILHNFTQTHDIAILTEHDGYYLAASEGIVSSTLIVKPSPAWPDPLAAEASVWLAQNQGKKFAALSCAAVVHQNN